MSLQQPATDVASALIDAAGTTCLSERDFAAPIDDRYFEDYQAGAVYEYGWIAVTEPQIIAFANAFDPQLMHTDPTASQDGPFGGLIASGWHTAAVGMRLFVDHYVSRVASLAAPGMEELRWPRPVRPGDRLKLRVTVESTRLSASRPDRGLVTTHLLVLNQDQQDVMSVKAVNFCGIRSAGPVIGRSHQATR